uniref:Secreted protein n=1 Tax=Macrostomum lignano TaxID=282301 RepID=A0A1I8HNJ3_9PLAT
MCSASRAAPARARAASAAASPASAPASSTATGSATPPTRPAPPAIAACWPSSGQRSRRTDRTAPSTGRRLAGASSLTSRPDSD